MSLYFLLCLGALLYRGDSKRYPMLINAGFLRAGSSMLKALLVPDGAGLDSSTALMHLFMEVYMAVHKVYHINVFLFCSRVHADDV